MKYLLLLSSLFTFVSQNLHAQDKNEKVIDLEPFEITFNIDFDMTCFGEEHFTFGKIYEQNDSYWVNSHTGLENKSSRININSSGLYFEVYQRSIYRHAVYSETEGSCYYQEFHPDGKTPLIYSIDNSYTPWTSTMADKRGFRIDDQPSMLLEDQQSIVLDSPLTKEEIKQNFFEDLKQRPATKDWSDEKIKTFIDNGLQQVKFIQQFEIRYKKDGIDKKIIINIRTTQGEC